MGLGSFLSGGGGFLLGGASSLLGSVISANKQEDINNANISNQWKMWNANNEYNSPINTINRYKEAGLNPALMYGNVSPGYASQMNMAVQHAPNYDFSGVGEAIGNALNYKQREKQIEIAEKNQQLATIKNAIDVGLEQSRLKAQTILNDRESAYNAYLGVDGYDKNKKYINDKTTLGQGALGVRRAVEEYNERGFPKTPFSFRKFMVENMVKHFYNIFNEMSMRK